MEQNNSDTNLSCVRCELETMSSVVSRCSQRKIHKSRNLSMKKKATVLWGTLNFTLVLVKTKTLQQSMGERLTNQRG